MNYQDIEFMLTCVMIMLISVDLLVFYSYLKISSRQQKLIEQQDNIITKLDLLLNKQ